MIASPPLTLETSIAYSELASWADRLGVSKVQLKSAINIVGPVAADVRAYFEKRRK